MAESNKTEEIRERLFEIIFEAETREGKIFDLLLLVFILASVILVIMNSVGWFHNAYPLTFEILEWSFTIIFTIEYLVRLWIVKKPLGYALSFYGIIDFLAIIPSYLGLIFVSGHALVILRALRILRVFRILDMAQYTIEGTRILLALRKSIYRIVIFFVFVLILVTIMGALMYVIEGGNNEGFRNIPLGIYWAVITLTTVGFGDITPQTPFGQFIAAAIMMIGYAIIIVPSGIVTSELVRDHISTNTMVCRNCGFDRHDDNADFCKKCGHKVHS